MSLTYPSQTTHTNRFSGFMDAEVEGSIPARFERIVRQFPGNLAIAARRRESYDELNQRANRIARAMLSHCGEGNHPVALLLGHDAPIVAAMLGALKAGKIYAALSPALPSARLRVLLDDLQAPLLVTNAEHRRLATGLARESEWVLNLDEMDETWPGENLEWTIAPETPAAIFYTSGSTGEPKGFVRNHRTILHRIRVDTNDDHLGADDRFSLLVPCNYGTSVSDLFDALLNGGTLALFDPNARGLGELSAWLRNEQITSLHLPVALFRQWLQTLNEDDYFPALRRLRPAGQLFRDDVERVWRHLPAAAQVFSQLASSETGLATRMGFTRQTPIDSEVLPVGRPVAETEVFLLDDTGRTVSDGEPGQIHVRSRYLASGYWRRPELSKEVYQFDLDDLAGNGLRTCRTGDWGRWRADGCLEFLGRQDAMVKIRGHRVELGEVEAALSKLAAIRAAAVIAQDDAEDGKRLVAYVAPARQTDAPTVSALRAALAQSLPEHAIPAVFVMLDEWPLLPNGKLDGRALPAPERARPQLDSTYRAPRTPVERELAAIWSEVLEVSPLGVDDYFLDLGGNSLRAMRIAVRVSRKFNVELTPRLLFESPTIAQMALVLEAGLGGQFDDTDARRRRHQSNIPNRDSSQRAQPAPLSFAQQRLWLLDRLRPGETAYNIAGSFRFTGALDVSALEQSLSAIVARHESLRTTFDMRDGAPVQIIHPPCTVEVPAIDLSSLPAEEREAEARRLLSVESERGFDLTRDRLLCVTLLRMSPREHILVVIKHHITSDGWSNGVFWRELSAHYLAFTQNESLALPPLPIQYADYAAWQNERWQSGALQSQLDYWRGQLADAPPMLELPSDRPRPARQSFRGATLPLEFAPDFIAALKDWSRRENATPFMALLTAFKVLLLRYTGQEDLVVGSPTAGRTHHELEPLIGCFLNNLVLRTRLRGEMTVREALGGVRATVVEAFAHQEVPFEALLETLHPERSASHTPLFQVVFNFLNTPPTVTDLGPLKAERAWIDNGTTKFDLSFALRETADGLSGYVEYSADLFDAATVERMIGHYHTLLAAMIARPDERIGELPLLTEAEHNQILAEWNSTTTDFGATPSLVRQFEQQTARTPDAVAFICGAELLTFRELNERANRLAHHLRAQGVKPGAVIGVCLERSFEMTAALLAVFKAGGVYLPLDPAYPQERLQFIIADAAPEMILTRENLPDADQSNLANPNNIGFEPAPLALEDPAYIIYTSGSTGRPRGVVVPHRQVLNRLAWMWRAYPLEPDDVGAQKTALNFVDSLWELLGYLLQGRPTAIIPDEALRDPRALVAALAEARVTQLWLVPSLLRVLLDRFPDLAERLPALRCWVSSGEPLSLELLHRFQSAAPRATLYNLYGTSEVWDATWYDPHVEAPLQQTLSGSVPIGRPIANVQCDVLDRRGQSAPIGVIGELYIGGAGLADSYLNQPELTAEKFVEWGAAGERLYRTGDLARWLPDGNLELLGRADFQVKLRGHRIELGEIEAALNRHPAVRQCVVVARSLTDAAEELQLIAYIVRQRGQPGQSPAPDELKDELSAWLAHKLPGYMIPAVFVMLEDLPLTPSGKLDRRALPAPAFHRNQARAAVAPRDPLELQLTRIWETVLKVRPLGVTDNFFELGGHSLLAVQLFDRIAQVTGRELPVAILYQTPTIEGIAALLRQQHWTPPWKSLVPVQPGGNRLPLFLAPPAGTTVLRFAKLISHLEPEQPVYGFQYLGLQGDERPHDNLEKMAAYHLAELRKLQPRGPYLLAGICFGSHLMLEVARQLRAAGEEIAQLIVIDAGPPSNGPTWDFDYWYYEPRSRFYYLRRVWEEWRKGQLLSLLKAYGKQAYLEAALQMNPRRRRRRQVLLIHNQAGHYSRAHPHPGRLVVLQSAELGASEVYQARWRALAAAEFDSEIIVGSTHPEVLFEEPYVQQLAEALTRRLTAESELRNKERLRNTRK